MVGFLVVLLAICSYLVGSIPNGYIAGRLVGIDVRKHGSGNIGATNVLRTLGKRFGYVVLFLDALKGFAAVRLGVSLAAHVGLARTYADWFGILSAVMCVVGHAFPVWLKFKGGKGVATSAGAMFGLAPVATLIAIVIWVIVFELTRYVSVASMAAVIVLPAVLGLFLSLHWTTSVPIFCSAIVLAVIVCWRHRSNITRLLRGNEQRFTRR